MKEMGNLIFIILFELIVIFSDTVAPFTKIIFLIFSVSSLTK